ncbi:MAG: hypothetical protein RLZZ303_412 [Candidatus Hydrogenedentota bacterium]|jgi:hypothetical protein
METLEDGARFLRRICERYEKMRLLGEGALAQLDSAGMHYRESPQGNSVAVIVKHLRGNMVSRWTDFLVSDGNKPWRQRDAEFETKGDESRETVMAWWNEGWDLTMATLASLTPGDLGSEVRVRGMPLDVTDALLRQYGHYSYHVGQIVLLARAQCGDAWSTLSIAKGASEQYQARPGD